ncbi:hypothetical protein BU25DRAFT_409321 [Macroventuria anomochaeta]|uniref:Uncharacterized protein n=1 Tax=Macroventuria anomochaeta TaxID=301207 RepID=A0ACB6S7A2_9PLEO|nr:uncharacterized protein BU25DRAFT_409321 [Macroventuria anomochaeta]KAF2629440.1 hypothetical protein BU25DRAFT_409321 [Macroventuria anomochaeta]
MTRWKQLRAQVRYCFLLTWETKLKGLVAEGVPTGTDLKAVLTEMCSEEGNGVEDMAAGVNRSLPDTTSPEPKRQAVNRETQAEPERDVMMVDQGTEMDERPTVTKDLGTQTNTRMSLEEWVASYKVKSTPRLSDSDAGSTTDTTTQNQPQSTPGPYSGSISEVAKASP